MAGGPEEVQAYEFILNEIDSVPHLEALLLLWNSRPNAWLAEDLGKRLYIDAKTAKALLQDLARRNLLAAAADEAFRYQAGSDRDTVIAFVDRIYRQQVVRISTLIHTKASSAVLDFARAFRLKKERE
jgi:predicted transcriptional regulator